VVLSVAVLLALAAALFFVVLSPRLGGEAWALSFTEGDLSHRFALSMDFTIKSPGDVKAIPLRGTLDQTITVRVVSVDADGTATLDVTIQEVSFTDEKGRTYPWPAGDSSRIRIAKDGTYVSVSKVGLVSDETTGMTLPGMDRFTPFLPRHAVEPGDSWITDVDVPVPFGDGSLGFRSKSVFLREETVDGRRAAVISGELKVSIDWAVDLIEMARASGEPVPDLPPGSDPRMKLSGQMQGTELSWYDPSASEALKSTTLATVDMTAEVDGIPQSGGIPQRVTLSGSFSGSSEKLA
jgi:hypothetical protein